MRPCYGLVMLCLCVFFFASRVFTVISTPLLWAVCITGRLGGYHFCSKSSPPGGNPLKQVLMKQVLESQISSRMSDVVRLARIAQLGRSIVDLHGRIIAGIMPPTSQEKPQKKLQWMNLQREGDGTCIPRHDPQTTRLGHHFTDLRGNKATLQAFQRGERLQDFAHLP